MAGEGGLILSLLCFPPDGTREWRRRRRRKKGGSIEPQRIFSVSDCLSYTFFFFLLVLVVRRRRRSSAGSIQNSKCKIVLLFFCFFVVVVVLVADDRLPFLSFSLSFHPLSLFSSSSSAALSSLSLCFKLCLRQETSEVEGWGKERET